MKNTFTKILCVAVAALSLTSVAAQQGYEESIAEAESAYEEGVNAAYE